MSDKGVSVIGQLFFGNLRPFPVPGMSVGQDFILDILHTTCKRLPQLQGAMIPPGIKSSISQPLRGLLQGFNQW
jgi:hypothetical protein